MNNDDLIRRGDVRAALAPFDEVRTHDHDCHERHVGCAVLRVLAQAPVPGCANCERLKRERDESAELHNRQLAAISAASFCNTEASRERWGIEDDNECWSVAYSDACEAVRREMFERSRAETAEARVAELEAFIRDAYEAHVSGRSPASDALERAYAALAPKEPAPTHTDLMISPEAVAELEPTKCGDCGDIVLEHESFCYRCGAGAKEPA